MPAPCCTQTQDPNQPPAGRPIPASSESEMRTCIRLCFSDALRGVLRHEKARQGNGGTPTGLKRLKTQNTASYDCNAKWERPYLALPNLYTSANSFRKKNSSTLPTLSKGTTFHTVRRKQKAGKHNMRCSFPLFFCPRIYILYFFVFEMHTPNL